MLQEVSSLSQKLVVASRKAAEEAQRSGQSLKTQVNCQCNVYHNLDMSCDSLTFSHACNKSILLSIIVLQEIQSSYLKDQLQIVEKSAEKERVRKHVITICNTSNGHQLLMGN